MSAVAKGCAVGAALVAGVCVSLPQDNHTFICGPGDAGTPEVMAADSHTLSLLDKGYFLPFAVSGIVAGGDNVGTYRLTCTLPAGEKPTGKVVDHNGVIYDAPTNPLGEYPIVG
jgi:hypothetical protein